MLKLTMSKRDVHPMRSWQKWVKWWCGMSKTQVSWDQSGHQKLWHHHHNPTANDRPQNKYKITYRINLNKLQNSSSQVLFKPASAQSRASSPAVNVSPTHTQVSLYHVQIYPNQMSLYSSHIRPLQKEGGPTPWTGITIELSHLQFQLHHNIPVHELKYLAHRLSTTASPWESSGIESSITKCTLYPLYRHCFHRSSVAPSIDEHKNIPPIRCCIFLHEIKRHIRNTRLLPNFVNKTLFPLTPFTIQNSLPEE